MHDETANSPHEVAVLVCDGFGVLEFGIACDVFGGPPPVPTARPWYRLVLCGPAGSAAAVAGVRVRLPRGPSALRTADTVVVLPAEPVAAVPAAVLDELRAARRRGARLVSLCSGALVLAAAGLLDGHRATTHWAEAARLAAEHPAVTVDPGVLFVDEGDLLTSAGSAAALDLCLHLVRRDHGSEVATRLARELVVPLQRDGGQAQYIDPPVPSPPGRDPFGDTLDRLRADPGRPVTVAELAERSAMSPRTFARRFLAATGETPYRWLVRERVRHAQRLLETSGLPIDAVALRSGFGTADNLRKHFRRTLRTTPAAYRRAFTPP
jgi:AraC family transcriptional regulator, transcriptional activator FtrA